MHIIVRQISLHSYAAFIVLSYFTPSNPLAETPNGNVTYFTEHCVWYDCKTVPLLHDNKELIRNTQPTSNSDFL